MSDVLAADLKLEKATSAAGKNDVPSFYPSDDGIDPSGVGNRNR